MQINAEKTQLMTNNTNVISTDITIDNKNSRPFMGAIALHEGSNPEVFARIAQTTAAVTKLKVMWNDKNIGISSKIRMMCSLAMSKFF